MDRAAPTILPDDLNALLGAAMAPALVDLRSAEQVSAADRPISRRAPAESRDIPPASRLGTIVRGADTARHDLAEQCGGLVAISLGLSANFPDDHQMLEHGMVIYDALYAWCRSLVAETHDLPAAD